MTPEEFLKGQKFTIQDPDGSIVGKNMTVDEFTKGQVAQVETPKQEKPPGLLKRIGNAVISSEKNFGESIGGAIASQTKDVKNTQELDPYGMKQKTVDAIRQKRLKGEDPSRLLKLLQTIEQSPTLTSEDINPALKKTNKQILGEAAGVFTDIASAGSYGGASKGTKSFKLLTKSTPTLLEKSLSPAKGLIKRTTSSIIRGAGAGALEGSAQGAARAAQSNEDVSQGALVGGLVGGATGGVMAGIAGALKSKKVSEFFSRRKEAAKLLAESSPGKFSPEIIDLDPTAEKSVVDRILLRPAAKDKVVKEVLDQGFDRADVAIIKNSSSADKRVFQKMLNTAEKASGDRTVAERPIQEAGKTVIKRAKFLLGRRQRVGEQLGEMVKSLPEEPVPVEAAYDDFVSGLSESGIKVKPNGVLDFRNSRYANNSKIQSQLQSLYKDIRPNSNGDVLRTPQRIYRIRQRLFTDLNLGKKNNEFDDYAISLMERTRSRLGGVLEDASPGYKKLSGRYAQITEALSDFNKLTGKNFDIDSSSADLRVGEVSNRLLGNASGRTMEILKRLEDTAVQNGFVKKQDVRSQVLFADLLEDLFGTTQSRSLRGQVQRGTQDAVDGVEIAADAATGNLGSAVLKTGKKLFGGKKPNGPTKEQLDALRKLLQR